MLVIKSLDDLVKYLEARKGMAARQILDHGFSSPERRWAVGATNAYEESIKAVKALIEHEAQTKDGDGRQG